MGFKSIDYSSIKDYVAYEYTTEAKHEYEKGQILMMSGGTIRHGLLCGDIKTSEADKDAVTNPILVVEVLSKSTESYDRGDKFHKYRQ